jgi:hypothetical protein
MASSRFLALRRDKAPSPQNEVVILGCRTSSEARHENASFAFVIKPPGNVPGRRLLSLRQQAEPGTRQILARPSGVRRSARSSQATFIRAQHAGLDLVCKPLVRFLIAVITPWQQLLPV